MNEKRTSATASTRMPAPDLAYRPLTRDRQRAKQYNKVLRRQRRQAYIRAIKSGGLDVVKRIGGMKK